MAGISANRRVVAIAAASLVAIALLSLLLFGNNVWDPVKTEPRTVAEVIRSLGPDARSRMQAHFDAAAVAYPPQNLTFLAVKDAAALEVWTDTDDGPVRIREYGIKALSGISGPKLREGDEQVPEGIYRIDGLNPNSSYHLSLELDYPNEFDLQHARREGRTEPGSNIFIHGKAGSIGCLAMGDEVIEELFVLVHDVGRGDVRIVIAPTDPRESALTAGAGPNWISDLYRDIEGEFRNYVLAAELDSSQANATSAES